MKSIVIPLAALLLLGQSVYAQETARTYIEGSLHMTFRNSYSRGNLDDWWAEKTGDPGRAVDQGSPAFFALEGRMMMPLVPGKLWMGTGIGFILPASHALWGSSLFYGGRQELVLKPQALSIRMPFRFRLEALEGLYAMISPAILVGWVTGTYSGPDNDYDFVLSPGIGFGLAAGAQFFFTESLGIDARAGLRLVKCHLSIKNPDSPTGYSKFLLSNGDDVLVNLGGLYLTIGVAFRMPI